MKQQNENEDLTNDDNDEIRADNALMKLKLEMDYGMKGSEFSEIHPLIEHQFLSQVLDFEKHYKDAKQVSIYDFLGRPSFRKAEELLPEEFSPELERLRSVMLEKNMVLDCIHTYPDELIYRFITEEFFLEETDDFMIEGMTKGFIYEEFHPGPDDFSQTND
jgi:hypothetical protein